MLTAIIFGSLGIICLLLVIPALFSVGKPIEKTRTDLDFPIRFHDMKIVPKDKEPTIRQTIPL